MKVEHKKLTTEPKAYPVCEECGEVITLDVPYVEITLGSKSICLCDEHWQELDEQLDDLHEELYGW